MEFLKPAVCSLLDPPGKTSGPWNTELCTLMTSQRWKAGASAHHGCSPKLGITASCSLAMATTCRMEDFVGRTHGIHHGCSTSQADGKIKTDLFPVVLTTTVAGKMFDALVLCLLHYLGYTGPETCILRQQERLRGTHIAAAQYVIVAL